MNAEFFFRLYRHCNGKIEIRPLPSGRQEFFGKLDFTGITKFLDKNSDEDLYFAVATRDGVGGKKENIVEIPAVWCDGDFKTTPREALRSNLKKFPFKPSIIVLSGGGTHLYWLLNEPLGPEDIPKVEDVNRRISRALGGDPAAVDASRVLRVPGTLNKKYDPPRLCEVAKANDFFYTLEDFIEYLPEESTRNGKGTPSANPEGWLVDALTGIKAGTVGRNPTGAKIAGYFIDKLPYRDILAILTAWNAHNSPPLKQSEIPKILNSVSRYKGKKRSNGASKNEKKRVRVSFS